MKKPNPEIKNLLSVYKAKRNAIKKRLADFKAVYAKGPARWFEELCFCLCTPQSKALKCGPAINLLVKTKILFKGSDKKIASYLKSSVRFHNKKSGYIVRARRSFCKNGRFDIKDRIRSFSDEKKARNWLVENIKGMDLKEASHFLRNIGLGDNLAIIDRHILTNLKKYGAIDRIPKNISAKQYLLLEEKMQRFSKEIGIPLAELDLLFWSSETGHIFK